VIDIFYRVRGPAELMHPRVMVTTAPDAERAQHLIQTLSAALPPEGETNAAGGRASRRRGTVAQLIARRDGASRQQIPAVRLVAKQA
jgi:hypothetical protein